MRSGELSQLTGVSTDTLRHYERQGILKRPPRTEGNYRQYEASAKQRVELIQRAVRIGFTLAELREILEERDRGGAPCRRVRELLGAKISHVQEQLRDLQLLRRELDQLRKTWDARLRKKKRGEPAHLLDNIPPNRSRTQRNAFGRLKSHGGDKG